MLPRTIQFQLAFAALGAVVLIFGVTLDLHWLAAAGLAASALSELIGLALIKLPGNSPALRLAQGACQAMPSVGIAMVLPWAMLVVVAVVINSVISGGVDSMLVSRTQGRKMGGELPRRLVLAMASIMTVVAAAMALQVVGGVVIPGTDAAGLLKIAVGWAMVAALISGIDATVALRGR